MTLSKFVYLLPKNCCMTSYLKTGFLYLGAITMLVMSFHYFQNEISGILEDKDIASADWYRLSFRLHMPQLEQHAIGMLGCLEVQHRRNYSRNFNGAR